MSSPGSIPASPIAVKKDSSKKRNRSGSSLASNVSSLSGGADPLPVPQTDERSERKVTKDSPANSSFSSLFDRRDKKDKPGKEKPPKEALKDVFKEKKKFRKEPSEKVKKEKVKVKMSSSMEEDDKKKVGETVKTSQI